MTFPRLIPLALLALAASPLSAGVSLVGQVGTFFGDDATTPVPVGSIAILVADTDKNSQAGLVNPLGTTLSLGSSLGGTSGDLIVGVYSVGTYPADDLGHVVTGIDFGGTTFTYDQSFTAGTDLWLLWFPSQSVAGAVLGAGVPFGSYRSDTVDFASGADIAFVAPPDGSVASLNAFSTSTGYGLASNLELSATSVTSASQPPTDLTLSVASVNPAAGLNAPIGTLATVDSDSTAFAYTLVAGPGSTDNALFNLSGSTLRAKDASSLALGSYSVRIQTDDGSATFAKTFTVTASHIGDYFGTLASGGRWALHVRGDNSAVYLAFLPARQSVLLAHLTIDAAGTFTVTDSEITGDAAQPEFALPTGHPAVPAASLYTLTGAIAPNGTISGTLSGLGDTLTGALDSATGPAQTSAGFYVAAALGTDNGATYTIVGASGQAVVVTTGNASVDGGAGTVDSDGHLAAITAVHGAALSLAIDGSTSSFTATVTPAGSSTEIAFAGLPDTITPTARLANLSVRSAAGSGSETLIVGFVVQGSGNKSLLLRGVGPSLVPFGVTDAIADPGLHVFDAAAAAIDANDDWGGSPLLSQTSVQVGAFALSAVSKDAALLVPLPAGLYSFHVTASSGGAGVALAEAYDADLAATGANLVNLSARSQVGTGENVLIAGFVITGNSPKTLLLRGLGPTLSVYGVTGVLADPQLELFRDNTSIASNNDWSGTPALKNAFALVGASDLAADTSKDAALLVTLAPGVYSAQVSGVAATTGVALVEIFLLP